MTTFSLPGRTQSTPIAWSYWWYAQQAEGAAV